MRTDSPPENAAQRELLRTGSVLRLFWISLGGMALFALFALGSNLAAAPDDVQVEYLPDDAFYYLVLAKNHQTLGMWTFDDGTTLTSGFQILFAYTLSAVQGLRRSLASEELRDAILLSSFLSGLVLALALGLALRGRSLLPLVVVTWLACTQIVLRMTVAVVEWPLIVMCSLLLVLAFARAGRLRVPALGVVAFAGTLARSDFPLLPMGLLAAAAALTAARWVDRNEARAQIVAALAACGGAGLGWLFGAALFVGSAGSWLQSSARMKSYWASLAPADPEAPLQLLANLLGLHFEVPAVVLWAGALTLAATPFLLARSAAWREDFTASHRTLAVGCCLALVSYCALYGLGADVQPWYTANLIVPLAVVLLAALAAISRTLGDQRTLCLVSLVAVASLAVNLPRVFPVQHGGGYWPGQRGLYAAGRQIGREALPGPLGAWNAGILRFASGRSDLLNLDGLVNNDIERHARAGTLPEYVRGMGIQHLIDFSTMVEDEHLRRRGGYDDPAFIGSLEPKTTFLTGAAPPWDRVVVYRLRTVGETGANDADD